MDSHHLLFIELLYCRNKYNWNFHRHRHFTLPEWKPFLNVINQSNTYMYLLKIYEIVMLTLQPSQVKAPKWKPAAGSPQTLHFWFI